MKTQRGMSLVLALFVIVVVASLTAFAVTVGANHREEASQGLMQGRALSAARAGAELGAYRAKVGLECPFDTTFNLNEAALRGFRVNVVCVASSDASLAEVTSTATYGNYGSSDYVMRQVSSRIATP